MLNRSLKRPLPFALALIVALLGLMSIVPLDTAAQSVPAPTVGEIVVDSYDCETGKLEFHVPVTDLPHIPDSNGSPGYGVIGYYDQGPDSELPGQSFNVEPEDSPFTGDLTLGSQVPPTNEIFISDGSEDPTGRIESIDIVVHVGYEGNPGPPDSSSTTYSVDCDDTDSDSAGDNDGDDDITALPETGAATATTGSEGILLVTLLSSIAAFLGLAALRIRLRM